MPDGIDSAVANAKSVLAEAQKKFPSPKAVPNAKPQTGTPTMHAVPNAKPNEPSIRQELGDKASNIGDYVKANPPKMHNGGPVLADGVYSLKKGEHVLTPQEADIARKNALTQAGLKSLAIRGKAAKTAPMTEPAGAPKKPASSAGKVVKGISVRPEKSGKQNAQQMAQ